MPQWDISDVVSANTSRDPNDIELMWSLRMVPNKSKWAKMKREI